MEDYLLVVSLPITLVVLAFSVLYSWNNLSRLWKAGDPNLSSPEKSSPDVSDVTVKHSDVIPKLADDVNCGGDGDKRTPAYEVDADPYEYCGHIQSEVKKARQRVVTREIRQNLSAEDMEVEREAQRKQLEDIFKLMGQQNDKFGMESMDEVKEQMKLYC